MNRLQAQPCDTALPRQTKGRQGQLGAGGLLRICLRSQLMAIGTGYLNVRHEAHCSPAALEPVSDSPVSG